ncbi:MAG: acyl-CoA/acyl-ACP dehydrogenase, partial [Deltaproteobacteria bacterium]|nr:acyl-CoA/acyl-ACP dehydrogenase [Deltaproteobacteria bacterium]
TDLECLTLQRLSSIKTGVSLRGFFNPLSGVRYPELPDQKTEHVFINPVSLDTTSQDIIVDADFGQYVFICWMSLTVGSLSQAISVVLNHCKSRKQFDREIGSFQLVQENIVKNFLNFLKFRASLIYSLNEVGNSLDLIKISLKNYLGNFRDTSDLLIQCCGGIGFTEEFGLSVFFRRFLRLLDIIDFE